MVGNTRLPPGFRFHPTDVELIRFYLKRRVMGKKLPFDCIAEIDIYKYPPWDLPHKSLLRTGDLKWYFFCPREKKYASGSRMNRATEFGYWKTTGKDRTVLYDNEVSGMIKTLVFHQGKAPKGERTDWVMYEYRLEDKKLTDTGVDQHSYVLSVIFKKDGPGPKNGAQYGAPFKEEDWELEDDEEEMNDIGVALFGAAPLTVLSVDRNNSAVTSPAMHDGSCVVSPLLCPLEKANAHEVPVTPDSENATDGGVSQAPLNNLETVHRAEHPASEGNNQGQFLAPQAVFQAQSVAQTVDVELPFRAAELGPGAVPESEGKEDDVLAMLGYFTEEAPFTMDDLNNTEQVTDNPNEAAAAVVLAGPGVDTNSSMYTNFGDVWSLSPPFGESENGYCNYLELMDMDVPLNGFPEQENGCGGMEATGGSGDMQNAHNNSSSNSVCDDLLEFVNSCWKQPAP
ncbi:NAC domain-containing protein 82 [Linum grandiflorum]